VGPRDEATRASREALLRAGLVVADQHGFDGMSVNRVVAEAGLAKGTFYVHFADRDAFIDAIHERFLEDLLAELAPPVAAAAPGQARLVAAAKAYFEFCLRNHNARALIADAGVSPNLGAFTDLVESNLRVMGFPHARAAAPLVLGMAVDVAIAELIKGGPDRPSRQALWKILELMDLTSDAS
jgi:AcrR family transcriptional regulator